MATYTIVAVSRTPQSATGPTLVELGPVAGTVSWTNVLNSAAEASVSVDAESLSDTIKARLRDLANQPTEIWIYRNSIKVFQGPIIGGEVRDNLLSLTCFGYEYYTAYMLVETAKSWTAIDHNVIVTDIIDDWQDQTYGDYGIDTVSVGASGTTRSFTIPGDEEPRVVYEVLRDLAEIEDGFDWFVDPTTSDLEMGARGTDKSNTVFLERGVLSPSVQFTVAPGIIASEVYASSTGGDTVLTSTKSNASLRSAWGRAGISAVLDDDPDATTLGDFAQAVLDDRGNMFFVPGPFMVPISGADVDDFEVGDTVTYTFDAGIGQQTGTYRIRKRQVTVDTAGQERMAVEFV